MIIKSKTCLIYSPGGHYNELIKSISGINFKNKYNVTFQTNLRKKTKNYLIIHPRRNFFRTIINFYQSFKILLKERPKLIISTGADVCLGTIILGKLFFKTRLIFIESAANVVTPTLTGRISYFFSDLFIIQHKDLIKYYPKAKLSKGFLQ